MKNSLAPETKQLLERYIPAFCNLYAITPVFRAWRIIQKQNPALNLTQEEFLDFLQNMDEDALYCAVIGQEEIYDDGREPVPPMKREILAQHLYIMGDFEDYEDLKENQEDKPFYVPEKEQLLRFADENYMEPSREFQALQAFIRDSLHISRAAEIMDDLYFISAMNGPDCQEAEFSLKRLGKMKRFPSPQAEEEFFRLYENMCDHIRMHIHRGHTPLEIRILCK